MCAPQYGQVIVLNSQSKQVTICPQFNIFISMLLPMSICGPEFIDDVNSFEQSYFIVVKLFKVLLQTFRLGFHR